MSAPIALDLHDAEATFEEVLARRTDGAAVAIALALDAPEVLQARAMWRILGMTECSRDEMWTSVAQVRAEPLAREELVANDGELIAHALDLADVAISDSWYRVRTTEAMLRRSIPRVRVELPPCESLRANVRGSDVVVLVPDGDEAARAFAVFALGDLHAPVRIVSAAQWETCTGATIIVDADWSSPATAARAAAFGVPIVVSATSGAVEVVQPAASYHPLYPESLGEAVRIAMSAGARTATVCHEAAAPIVESVARELHVTYLIRTKDRPELLERAVASVGTQRGVRADAVVLNDGGVTVAEMIERYPFANLIERTSSNYVRAAPDALAAATGTYVVLLDDDDALFPDHARRLAEALERSGGAIAFCDALAVYLEGDAALTVRGYRRLLVEYVDRDAVLVENPISGALRVMYRRETLVAAGGFRELTVALDYDAYVRMTRANDIVRVPFVGAQYSIFADGRNRSIARAADQAQAHLDIYARHPVSGRAAVEAARRERIAHLRNAGAALSAPLARLSQARTLVRRTFA